jgi:hypothetical protein
VQIAGPATTVYDWRAPVPKLSRTCERGAYRDVRGASAAVQDTSSPLGSRSASPRAEALTAAIEPNPNK